MKKVFMTMAVLTGLVAGGMMFSSFTTPTQDEVKECMQLTQSIPAYWDGMAHTCGRYSNWISITVYQTEGQCNSFYAVLEAIGNNAYLEKGKQLWVKVNPDYDKSKSGSCYRKYYVTYQNENYFFDM